MNGHDLDIYVIGDTDGYWTIVPSDRDQFLVSKFLLSGSIRQVELQSMREAEEYILKEMYGNLLIYAG